MPRALIAELNRHRGTIPIRLAAAGTHARVGEAAALAAALRARAHVGKITSVSLVTMGLPGSVHTLNTPHKVWMFGIAHPTESAVALGGPIPGPERAESAPAQNDLRRGIRQRDDREVD